MSEIKQNTPQWLALRQNFIGASDAPTILGLNPYKTIHELWEEKLGLRSAPTTNAAMQRGKDLEPVALEEFCATLAMEFEPCIVFHPTIPFMMCSLDGRTLDQEYIVEIKCPGKADHQLALSGKVPPKYFPQLQHQLAVTGLKFAYYYSFDGEKGVIVKVNRDDDYIENLIEKEREFWECVETLTAPKCPFQVNETDEWKSTAEKYLEVQFERLRLEKMEALYKEQLIAYAEDKETKGAGIKLVKEVRKGALEYDKIPQLEGIDLDQFRKPPTSYWKIVRDK